MRLANIVVADRGPVFLCDLINILQSTFQVGANCCDGMKCLQAELSPDIALLDSSMPTLGTLY